MTRDDGIGLEYLRRYRPDLFKRYRKWKRVFLILPLGLPVGLMVLAAAISLLRGGQDWNIAGGTFVVIFLAYQYFFFICVGFYGLFAYLAWSKNRALRDRENIDMAADTKRYYGDNARFLTELQAREIGARIVAQPGAVVYNNSFNNSTIVDRSTLVESMNSIKHVDSSLADSLQVLAGVVQNSNDTRAIETLNEFNRKIAQRENKITLRALWEQLVKLVPDVATIGEATLRIIRYLS
jgi:hypothetical protein